MIIYGLAYKTEIYANAYNPDEWRTYCDDELLGIEDEVDGPERYDWSYR
jgi:hypothetical protein